jgi:hypothetical protein
MYQRLHELLRSYRLSPQSLADEFGHLSQRHAKILGLSDEESTQIMKQGSEIWLSGLAKAGESKEEPSQTSSEEVVDSRFHFYPLPTEDE